MLTATIKLAVVVTSCCLQTVAKITIDICGK